MAEIKSKVFIVDDSKFFVDWITDQITSIDGVEVVGSCGEVRSSSKRILETKPDTVILDIRLQDGNGIEILKNFKEKAWKPKFIVFTNYPWQVFQQQCKTLGADYFFDKSIEFSRLKETITSLADPQSDPIVNGKDSSLLL
jgi:DNA-binding NarL/FixJ family response regulator